jgi:hypothetical protein
MVAKFSEVFSLPFFSLRLEHEIEEELERAHCNKVLCSEEQEVLIKNIELLRNYRITRSINKTVYYSGITSLAHIIQ